MTRVGPIGGTTGPEGIVGISIRWAAAWKHAPNTNTAAKARMPNITKPLRNRHSLYCHGLAISNLTRRLESAAAKGSPVRRDSLPAWANQGILMHRTAARQGDFTNETPGPVA